MKKPMCVCVYHHRGSVDLLRNTLLWFSKCKTNLELVVRLDEDDGNLQACANLPETLESEEPFHFTIFIGPSDRDALALEGEVWAMMPEKARHLIYVTDSATSLACFVLAYEAESARN